MRRIGQAFLAVGLIALGGAPARAASDQCNGARDAWRVVKSIPNATRLIGCLEEALVPIGPVGSPVKTTPAWYPPISPMSPAVPRGPNYNDILGYLQQFKIELGIDDETWAKVTEDALVRRPIDEHRVLLVVPDENAEYMRWGIEAPYTFGAHIITLTDPKIDAGLSMPQGLLSPGIDSGFKGSLTDGYLGREGLVVEEAQ